MCILYVTRNMQLFKEEEIHAVKWESSERKNERKKERAHSAGDWRLFISLNFLSFVLVVFAVHTSVDSEFFIPTKMSFGSLMSTPTHTKRILAQFEFPFAVRHGNGVTAGVKGLNGSPRFSCPPPAKRGCPKPYLKIEWPPIQDGRLLSRPKARAAPPPPRIQHGWPLFRP